jgi:hypothetical protein
MDTNLHNEPDYYLLKKLQRSTLFEVDKAFWRIIDMAIPGALLPRHQLFTPLTMLSHIETKIHFTLRSYERTFN